MGTEHVFVRRFAGMKIESRNRFTAYVPGRFVSFEIPSGTISGEASYLVEATGATTSLLISEVHFRVSGPAGLATPLLARVFARDSTRDEGTLKALLEKEGGSTSWKERQQHSAHSLPIGVRTPPDGDATVEAERPPGLPSRIVFTQEVITPAQRWRANLSIRRNPAHVEVDGCRRRRQLEGKIMNRLTAHGVVVTTALLITCRMWRWRR